MPYYKALNNSLHFLDIESFAHLLPAGAVQITDIEAAAIRPSPDREDVIKSQLLALESQITQRRLREAILGNDAFLIAIEAQIHALRATL